MIRTQIYLPDETHTTLLRLAKDTGTTLSKLIREGANHVIRAKYGKLTPQQKAIRFFTHLPDKYKVKLTKPAWKLIREERD